MGMHFGVIGADLRWSELQARLRTHAKEPLIDKGPAQLDELDALCDDLVCGELEGRSYVLDLTGAVVEQVDLLAALAREARTLVVGFHGQDTSGYATFFAARGDTVLRHFAWSSRSVRPYDVGAPLPTEAVAPLVSGGLLTASRTSGSPTTTTWSAARRSAWGRRSPTTRRRRWDRSSSTPDGP